MKEKPAKALEWSELIQKILHNHFCTLAPKYLCTDGIISLVLSGNSNILVMIWMNSNILWNWIVRAVGNHLQTSANYFIVSKTYPNASRPFAVGSHSKHAHIHIQFTFQNNIIHSSIVPFSENKISLVEMKTVAREYECIRCVRCTRCKAGKRKRLKKTPFLKLCDNDDEYVGRVG